MPGEINGTSGTLRVTADAAYPEIYPLTIAGAHGPDEPAELAVPAALTHKWLPLTGLAGAPAYNVGRACAAFAADIGNGTHTVPDFADAVRRHEVIAAIEREDRPGRPRALRSSWWSLRRHPAARCPVRLVHAAVDRP